MNLAAYIVLARYNRLANELVYQACAGLDDNEYKRKRAGSFASIHGLLNHLLLADKIWMARFEGHGRTTPPLDTVLYSDFATLAAARRQEDDRIEQFFKGLSASFLEGTITYTNSRGIECAEQPIVAVTHFFNHQTHHRGQVHVMLSQTGVQPPSLDLHRIINP